MNKHSPGFTLLEILLVVAAIAVLAGIVIVAINPGRQLGAVRNTARQSDITSVLNAVYQYSLDNEGAFPTGTDSNLRMLGTDISGCSIGCTGVGSGSSSSSQSTPINFIDNDQTTFSGSFSNTQYDSGSALLRISSGASGSYISSIKDAVANPTWTTLAWSANRPVGKNLPNNGQVETAYTTGNIDMANNVLLLHLDENSGTTSFTDSSGNNNNGSCSNPNCPTMTAGKINNTPNFSSGNSPIVVPHSDSLNLTNQFTVGAWFYPIATSSWTSYGHLMGRGFSGWPGGWTFSISGSGVAANTYWRVFLVEPGGKFYEYQNGTWLAYNKWVHFIFTFDNGVGKMYINGTLLKTKTFSFSAIRLATLPLHLGYGQYNGMIDEAIIFSRTLSGGEISDIYKRGALSLKYQARSCSLEDCSDGTFVGPDGTASSYYSEANNTSNSTPAFSLTNLVSNRYFQYKAFFDTANNTLTPELKSVSISGTTVAGNSTSTPASTVDGCLDLTPSLVSNYITAIPFDPKVGSTNKTYYAIRKTTGNRINVVACNTENNDTINVTR